MLARLLASLAALVTVSSSHAQDPRLRTLQVADGVYMLMGNGGNVGLSVGGDGAVLIDDQFAPMVGQIQAAVEKVSKKPVRFLINTHWHGDHTGGNERFGAAGALIVAHENVRKRMSAEQFLKPMNRKIPPAPAAALPVVTFDDTVTFHWNGDEIRAFHVALAHTDGDSIIHFTKANILHMGDCFFNGIYPFIDTSSGGTIDGMIAVADRVLALCDAQTRIIPGHGELAAKDDLEGYRDMLATVRKRIVDLIARGKGVEEIVAAAPTAEFDAKWGRGFMKPERWVRIVYDSLPRE